MPIRSAIAACLLALACALPARAQSAIDAAGFNRASPVRKRVRSMRELRFADMTRQQYDFSCGSAALASLLQHGYGIAASEPELVRQMMVGADPKEVVRNGFSMLDMKRYVERIGLRAHGYKVDAGALYRLKMPVIALIDTKGYTHFVVVKGASSGRVFVADPALGHRVIPEAEFVDGWNGILLAVIADRPLRTDTRLVQAAQSDALRHRIDTLDHATTPPRLLEFGLVHADLF